MQSRHLRLTQLKCANALQRSQMPFCESGVDYRRFPPVGVDFNSSAKLLTLKKRNGNPTLKFRLQSSCCRGAVPLPIVKGFRGMGDKYVKHFIELK